MQEKYVNCGEETQDKIEEMCVCYDSNLQVE